MTGMHATDRSVIRLPDLPSTDTVRTHFNLAEQGAALGYQSRHEKWDARLYREGTLGPSFNLDYGQQLSSHFGAGGSYTLQSDYSEMVLNGIYAPKKNVRLRVAGSQVRSTAYQEFLNGGRDPVLQNGYLLGARKYWNKYVLLSDLGITAYAVEANAGSRGASEEFDAGTAFPESLAPGRLEGYLLDLGLHPTPQSRLRFRRESGQLSYYFDSRGRQDERLASSEIRYSQHFDSCVQLQAGYSMATDSERMDVGLARNNWNLALSHLQSGSGSDMSLRIGYALPLGGKPADAKRCRVRLASQPFFEPIVDASVKRPQQFPRSPLLSIDAQ